MNEQIESMNQTTTDAGQGLEIQIIDLYGQLLLDINLIFAIILAWAVTHFIKQSPWIRGIHPISQRKFTIRLVSVMIGFGSVVFFKRHMIDAHLDHIINFGIIVAFTHPFIYKFITALLSKFAPSIAESLRTK